MPKVALADTLSDWDQLITAARKRAAKNPELVKVLDGLEKRRDRTRQLESERLSLEARRQAVTKEIQRNKQEGKALASRLRSGLKAALGMQSEALTEFNIRPRRPYGRRKKASSS